LSQTTLTREGIFGNAYALAAVGTVIVFQMVLTYVTPIQNLFGTDAIRFASWMRIAAVSSSVLFLVEFEKFVFRKYHAVKKKLS
jgi:magnesium-transporting ATPase (P-type)